MCFYRSHQFKNTKWIFITFNKQTVWKLKWKWIGSLVIFFFFFVLKLVSTKRCSQTWTPTQKMTPAMRRSTWRASAQHFRTNSVFFNSVDDNQTFLLLLFFRWISRKCLLVGYLRVHELGLLWCLLDASWCNMKNKEKSLVFCFFCKYNLFSCGCPGPSLSLCDWTKVKSSCLLFRHSGRIPDLQLWLWRLKKRSDSKPFRSGWTFRISFHASSELMVIIILVLML